MRWANQALCPQAILGSCRTLNGRGTGEIVIAGVVIGAIIGRLMGTARARRR